MYPSTFKEYFPCGLGFEWEQNSGKFQKQLMTSRKVSMASLEWLDYMSNDKRFIDETGEYCKIKHGWNSNEVKIGNYQVDGYCVVGTKVYVLEFDGCRFHSCVTCMVDEAKLLYNKNRTSFIKKMIPNVEIIRMRECDWNKLRRTVDFTPKISPILLRRIIPEKEFHNLLTKNKLYGFALVDICATEKADFFKTINWPPIFKKVEVQHSDLPIWMQKNAFKSTFPRKTIIQSMSAENILLHTELIRFYIEHGFCINKIHKLFEYQPSKCFEDVYHSVYNARVEATESNDDLKQTAVKLVSNSMYGQMLMVMLFLYF